MRRLGVLPAALPLPGCEAQLTGTAPLPWVAMSLAAAVVLVLLGALLGGRARAARDESSCPSSGRSFATAPSPTPPAPAAGQAWRALAPGMTWRTDATLRIVEAQGSPGDAWPQAAQAWMHRPLQELLADAPHAQGPSLSAALASRERVFRRRVQSVLAPAAHTLELGAEPLHDDAGRFAGYVGYVLVTAADSPATPAQEGTAASFSYTLSHDLRAPLRVVDGFARILKEDYGGSLDRVGLDHLDRVLNAAGRMNRMIDAMLAVARLNSQPLQRQPVDLTQVAERVVEELRRQEPGREVQVQLQPGLRALGDPAMLAQVMDNLIGNAWKYTGATDGARVTVGCERAEDGQQVFLVRDNGAGFDMRGVDRLFGLFQRLHSSSEFPGTGVGLASVREIVNRHGGRVWAESAPGQGATFRFTLGA